MANPVPDIKGSNPGTNQLQGTDGVLKTERVPDIFIPLNAVLITAETTLWTPTAGKFFRLLGYNLSYGVVAGPVSLRNSLAGTITLIIPNQALNVPIQDKLGNGFLGLFPNSVLTAIGTATQTLTGYIYGVEEAF